MRGIEAAPVRIRGIPREAGLTVVPSISKRVGSSRHPGKGARQAQVWDGTRGDGDVVGRGDLLPIEAQLQAIWRPELLDAEGLGPTRSSQRSSRSSRRSRVGCGLPRR